MKSVPSLREGMCAHITKTVTVLDLFDSAHFGLEFKGLFSCTKLMSVSHPVLTSRIKTHSTTMFVTRSYRVCSFVLYAEIIVIF